jgi:hypothetical protein
VRWHDRFVEIAGHIDANSEFSTGKSTGPTPQAAGITEGAF